MSKKIEPIQSRAREIDVLFVQGDSGLQLKQMCEDLYKNGYRFQGGVSITSHGAGFRMAIAMVREGK